MGHGESESGARASIARRKERRYAELLAASATSRVRRGRGRESIPVKTCEVCGHANPAVNGFCINCGVSLAGIAASDVGAETQTQAYFTLPAYLRRELERPRRRPQPESSGYGFLWVGLFLAVGALVTSAETTLGATAWGSGVLLIIFGFWKLRRDRQALGRAGLVTNGAALIALVVVVSQLAELRGAVPLGSSPPPFPTPTPTAVPDWNEASATASPSPVQDVNGVMPMFRGDPGHRGVNPGPEPVGDPVVIWRLDTGGEVYSSPAVAGGLVYVGTKGGFVYALDGTNMEERWRFDLGDYIIRSSPAVVDGTVYVGAGFTLFALDARTGEERWRFTTRYASQSSPAVVDGVVYVGTQEGFIYAVDGTTGTEHWHYQAEGLVFSSPAVAGGRVYFGADDGDLYALDTKNGRLLWRFETGGAVYASPSVADGQVFISSRSRTLFAVDAVTGKERWQLGVGGESSPAVADGIVYLGSDDGGLYAVDAANGTVRWLFATGTPIKSSPVLAGQTIYFGSGQTLYAVDAQTNAKRWAIAANDVIESSPAVVNGVVYFGSRDGFLYAIGGSGFATPSAR